MPIAPGAAPTRGEPTLTEQTLTAPGRTEPNLTAPGRTPSSRTPSIRRMIVGLALAVIVAGTSLLARVGCERMREVAPLGSADSFGRTVVGHGWSVDPIGFTVRYDDGTSATQLWW